MISMGMICIGKELQNIKEGKVIIESLLEDMWVQATNQTCAELSSGNTGYIQRDKGYEKNFIYRARRPG